MTGGTRSPRRLAAAELIAMTGLIHESLRAKRKAIVNPKNVTNLQRIGVG